jgi:hypothetical protein
MRTPSPCVDAPDTPERRLTRRLASRDAATPGKDVLERGLRRATGGRRSVWLPPSGLTAEGRTSREHPLRDRTMGGCDVVEGHDGMHPRSSLARANPVTRQPRSWASGMTYPQTAPAAPVTSRLRPPPSPSRSTSWAAASALSGTGRRSHLRWVRRVTVAAVGGQVHPAQLALRRRGTRVQVGDGRWRKPRNTTRSREANRRGAPIRSSL